MFSFKKRRSSITAATHSVVRLVNESRGGTPERYEIRRLIKADPVAVVETIKDTVKAYGPHHGTGYLVGCLGEALAYEKGGPKEIDRALKAISTLKGTRSHAILAASRAQLAGDHESAYAGFRHACAIRGRWDFPSHRGAHNIVWEETPSWLRFGPRKRSLSAPLIWIREPQPHQLTAVFCGDKRYFNLFARDAAGSLRGTETPIHFHVVGWDEDADATLNSLDHSAGISASTEQYGYAEDYTYFATNRFLRAIDFLRVMGPIYISDLDNVFVSPPEDNRNRLRKHDAALSYRVWTDRLPWLSPNAGHVFLNNTSNGLEIAQHMANYIDWRFKPNKGKNWYFDQLLLNEVARHSRGSVLRMNSATCVTAPLPKDVANARKQHRFADQSSENQTGRASNLDLLEEDSDGPDEARPTSRSTDQTMVGATGFEPATP